MTSDPYSFDRELEARDPDLRLLGQRLVRQIHETTSVYEPRRAKGLRTVVSKGWRSRLLNYEWPYRTEFIEASKQVEQLADNLGELSQKIDRRYALSPAEGKALQQATRKVFEWGGVTRGASKQNPSVELITSVIRSAVLWEPISGAPMDSGWTKIAALSTHWLEGSKRTPQVIYDSRVANALIRNVERLAAGEDKEWLSALSPCLKQRLRKVSGRGGTRNEPYQSQWKSGYRSWEAQYFGSFLVRLMRDALNSEPQRYGLMPRACEPDGFWSMRGVEMVLFMDGY